MRDPGDVPCPFFDILREPDSQHCVQADRWIKAKSAWPLTVVFVTSSTMSPEAATKALAVSRSAPGSESADGFTSSPLSWLNRLAKYFEVSLQ